MYAFAIHSLLLLDTFPAPSLSPACSPVPLQTVHFLGLLQRTPHLPLPLPDHSLGRYMETSFSHTPATSLERHQADIEAHTTAGIPCSHTPSRDISRSLGRWRGINSKISRSRRLCIPCSDHVAIHKKEAVWREDTGPCNAPPSNPSRICMALIQID